MSEEQIESPEIESAETESSEMESQGLPLEKLTPIIEAALFAASEPLSLDRLLSLFFDDEKPEKSSLREVIANLQQQCEGRGVELVEVASGYRYQVRRDVSQWVSRLWQERATRYSRALLETLVLIAYRQPVTRAEIEDIRGVAVSSNIMKTLQERGWARVIGHRDVPGRPGLYATTREFLDYFNLKSLDELPPLSELKDFDQINAELDLRMPGEQTEEGDDAVLAEGDEDLAEEVMAVSETTDTDETDDQEPQQPDLEQSDEVKVEEEIETPPSDRSDNEEQLPQ
ncbi:MAG: SMC-Scp complex subunit ScpB [Gammaproteobacteria bacterium]|nr:SMC-Scp complex subunit ScpB [Gammaproteobacteria bacterium]